MEKSKKVCFWTWLFLLCSIGSVLIMMGSFAGYVTRSTLIAEDIQIKNQISLVNGNINSVNRAFDAALDYIKSCASTFDGFDEIHSPRALEQLEKMQENSFAGRLALIDLDGNISYGNDHDALNVSDREYFSRAINGEGGIYGPVESRYDGKISVVVYSPVVTENGIIGILTGVLGEEFFKGYINTNGIGDADCFAIINQNGKFAFMYSGAQACPMTYDSLWDYDESEKAIDDNSRAALKSAIDENRSGYMIVGDSSRFMLHYAPLQLAGWYAIQLQSYTVVEDNAEASQGETNSLIVKVIMAVMLVFLSLIELFYQSYKEQNKTQKKIQTLVNNIPGGVAELIFDGSLKLAYANSGFYQMFGYTRQQYEAEIGDEINDKIIADGSCEAVMKSIESSVKKHLPFEVQINAKKRSGETVWVSIKCSEIDRTDRKQAVIQAVLTDITAQKLQEY